MKPAFPLSELCVLAGVAFSVAGFLAVDVTLIGLGTTLALLAGIELTLRGE
jgi:hypothetical protein